MSLTTTRRATTSVLRLATRLLTISAVIGLILVASMAALAIAIRTGTALPYTEAFVSHPCIAIGVTLVTAALVIPSFAPLVTDLRRIPRQRRLYHQMHPLWLALIRAAPHVCLHPPRHPEHDPTWWLTGSYRRMYRKVIEIYDGLRHLNRYLDPDIHTTAYRNAIASGADSRQAAAIAEATAIAAALHRLNTGAPRRDHPASPPAGPDGSDVEADAAWLAHVSVVFAIYDGRNEQISNPT
jgi:hypothetical protein